MTEARHEAIMKICKLHALCIDCPVKKECWDVQDKEPRDRGEGDGVEVVREIHKATGRTGDNRKP